MTTALNGTDPVIFMESQPMYDKGEEFHLEGVPTESYEIPFGEPDIKRQGKDITILTIGPTLYKALKAADILKEQFGLELDSKKLVLPDAIKSFGGYQVKAKLGYEISGLVNVLVCEAK